MLISCFDRLTTSKLRGLNNTQWNFKKFHICIVFNQIFDPNQSIVAMKSIKLASDLIQKFEIDRIDIEFVPVQSKRDGKWPNLLTFLIKFDFFERI